MVTWSAIPTTTPTATDHLSVAIIHRLILRSDTNFYILELRQHHRAKPVNRSAGGGTDAGLSEIEYSVAVQGHETHGWSSRYGSC